jgi:hypothetical protein
MAFILWSSLWKPSALGVWEAVEVVGAVVVTIGVIGEYIANFTKLPKGRSRKKQWEKRSTLILIVGLAIELVGLVTTLVTSNIEIQQFRSNNLALEAKVLELRAKLEPRTITEKQKEKFTNLLKNAPKCPVRIHCGNVDNETRNYAYQLREMLDNAGYGANGGVVFDLGNTVRTMQFSGIMLDCPVTNMELVATPPAYFTKVEKAFQEIGIVTLGGTFPLPQAYPEEAQEMIKRQWAWPPALWVPGEIAIVVNDRAY